MQFSTAPAPHLHAGNSVFQHMLPVLQALCPAILVSVMCFGAAVLIQLVLAIITALVTEIAVLWLRKRPLQTVCDLSAIVSATLLALSLPVYAPWWLSVNGTLFALLIGKHIYGGLGYNPFNPAMVGYAFLLISFPQPMTAWLAFDAPHLTLSETWQWIFSQHLPASFHVDALTRATPLDTVKTQLRLGQTLNEIYPLPVFGVLAGKSYQWVALAYLGGGLWLLQRKVIGWHIPLAFLATLSTLALCCFIYDATHFSSPVLHLCAGSTFLGAFFIATDPVTAATSMRGRLIYGGLIGVLLYCMRTWGGYPDGMAFAVLLANLTAPTLDYYTRPTAYGQS